MANDLTWVTCDGGPHLLLPAELECMWCGINPPSDGREVQAHFRWSGDYAAPASDYDAACDVNGLVGLIQMEAQSVLVLGDEVPMSTWLASQQFAGGIIVVPMEWPNSHFDVDAITRAVAQVELDSYLPTGLSIDVPTGTCRLVAAANFGPNWTLGSLPIAIPPASYTVLSAEVHADGFWLRLHALQAAT